MADKDNDASESMTRNWMQWLLVALAVFGLLGTGVMAYKYNQAKNDPKTSQAAIKKANQKLVEKVGKLILIPKGVDPVIAKVDDKSKLKDQPFFKNAENGDKVLIYANDKKAFLYRESTNQLINVGPIAVNSTANTPAGTSVTNSANTTAKPAVTTNTVNKTTTR